MWKAKSKKACIPTQSRMYLSRVIPRQDVVLFSGEALCLHPIGWKRSCKSRDKTIKHFHPTSCSKMFDRSAASLILYWDGFPWMFDVEWMLSKHFYPTFRLIVYPLSQQSIHTQQLATKWIRKNRSADLLCLVFGQTMFAHLPTKRCVYPIK